jgi:uncharacterized protein YbjT (DUF2867 family)
MDVVIAGGHGQIALRLERLLSARGDRVRGLVRRREQFEDLSAAGAEPVLADLEDEVDLGPAVQGTDAVVFAAGAGAGSGPERKQTMDYGGAVKLIEAAKAAGITRYVIVSSMGADNPEAASGTFRVYLEAKAAADQAVRESGLDYTVVRPGSLMDDDPGTGLVDVAEKLGRRGSIARDDVAAVLVAVLDTPSTIGLTFEVLSGSTPIEDAIRAL